MYRGSFSLNCTVFPGENISHTVSFNIFVFWKEYISVNILFCGLTKFCIPTENLYFIEHLTLWFSNEIHDNYYPINNDKSIEHFSFLLKENYATLQNAFNFELEWKYPVTIRLLYF